MKLIERNSGKENGMKKTICLLVVLAMVSACATVPSTINPTTGEVDPVLVREAEAVRRHNSTISWIAAISIGLAVMIASSSDSESGTPSLNCFWVIHSDGSSSQVCR